MLLSKHQQVQVMEAAAILVHGSSLPQDRALWPSYMSGGALASPRSSTEEKPSSADTYGARSPASTTRFGANSSQFDDEELEDVSEQEDEEADQGENTDESDEPAMSVVDSTLSPGRTRSHSTGVQTHMPHLRASYGGHPNTYGWGVIAESGQHNAFSGSVGTKSPTSEMARSPMAIPNGNVEGAYHPSSFSRPTHYQHQSMSSFGSFTHSFSSASASSYIPSSSMRSRDGLADEEDPKQMEDMDDEDIYDYSHSARTSSLYTRLTSVAKGPASRMAYTRGGGQHVGFASSGKSVSPDRSRDEDMYTMDMD